MTHDPMCPYRPAPPDEYAPFEATVPCQCDLIAKVRADTLVKARKAVEVLPHTADCKAWWDEGHDCLHRDVTAVLDAMVGSPDLADAMAANSHTIRR